MTYDPKKHPKPTAIVPIYSVKLWIVITDDIGVERLKFDWAFGPGDGINYSGLSSYGDGKFAIFLRRNVVCHELIAHEIFHLTHRILEHTTDRFSPEHHEPYAYLCGWLSEQVYLALAKSKCRVAISFPE